MNSKKTILSALALCFSLSATMPVYAGGIPVLDAANLINTAENIVQWGKQLTEMKNQLIQAKAQFDSLNGLRGIGSLLNNELLVQYIPKDYQDAYQKLMDGTGGDFAGLSGKLTTIKTLNQKYTCAQLNTDAALIAQCENQWNKLALDKEVGDLGYKQAAKNIENLQTFVSSINESTDPKSLYDLQARIQIEQVRMQNEMMKLETMKMMAEADKKLTQQKYSDAGLKGASKGGDGGLSGW